MRISNWIVLGTMLAWPHVAQPAEPSGIQMLTSGASLSGEVRSGSSVWPFTVRITSYNASSGAIVGELTWPTLGSVHGIRGTLQGSNLSFTETDAIRRGTAHLNVAYAMTVGANSATGTWVDNGDRSSGTATIRLPGAGPTEVVQTPVETGTSSPGGTGTAGPAGVNELTSGAMFSGAARSGSSVWPCTVRITSYNASSGAIVGELTWPTLGSVHGIRGTLQGSNLSFTETEAIRRGSAHLNVAYTMTVAANGATGTWVDNGDRSSGTFTIRFQGAGAAVGTQVPGGTVPNVANVSGKWLCPFMNRYMTFQQNGGHVTSTYGLVGDFTAPSVLEGTWRGNHGTPNKFKLVFSSDANHIIDGFWDWNTGTPAYQRSSPIKGRREVVTPTR